MMNIFLVKLELAVDYWQLYLVKADTKEEAARALLSRQSNKHAVAKVTKLDFDSSWRPARAVLIAQDIGKSVEIMV